MDFTPVARDSRYPCHMCRSIKTLRAAEPATEDEIYAAALQYVRKISGYRAPSKRNQAAFEAGVTRVADATRQLLDEIAAAALHA